MIKFFRKIRQDLLSKGKTGKYLKYAIGEIILVVIGILIALGINNWNQERIGHKKELDLLKNLKEELYQNVSIIKEIDSVYTLREKECKEGVAILKQASTVDMILKADSLLTTRWAVFRINRSTYDEMLNNGSFYSLNNKGLKQAIRKHFTYANNYLKSFQEINENGQDIAYNENLNIIDILEDRMNNEYPTLKGLDTTWITNQNSPQYLALYKKGKYFTKTNRLRKRMIGQFIGSCEELAKRIEIEIK